MADDLRPAPLGVSDRDWSVLVSWDCPGQDEMFECEPVKRVVADVRPTQEELF